MFKEYDVIKATHNLSELVNKGCRGTIVMVFEKPSLAYEVEFFDDGGGTLELLTVEQHDIIRRQGDE